MPAVRFRHHSMLHRQLFREFRFCSRRGGAQLDPFERQRDFARGSGDSKDSWHTHGCRLPQLFEPGRFRLEHGTTAPRRHFHENRTAIALPTVTFIDRAAVHARAGIRLQPGADGLTNRCG